MPKYENNQEFVTKNRNTDKNFSKKLEENFKIVEKSYAKEKKPIKKVDIEYQNQLNTKALNAKIRK